jgi:hypothetical protein
MIAPLDRRVIALPLPDGRQPRRLTLSISPADAGASLSHRLSGKRIIAHRHARASPLHVRAERPLLPGPRKPTRGHARSMHLEGSINPITILHVTTRRSLDPVYRAAHSRVCFPQRSRDFRLSLSLVDLLPENLLILPRDPGNRMLLK